MWNYRCTWCLPLLFFVNTKMIKWAEENVNTPIIMSGRAHLVSRQSSTLVSVPAWPRKGRQPADGKGWSWQNRRLWSTPLGAPCTMTDRRTARWHMLTAWRWRHSGWRRKRERVSYIKVDLLNLIIALKFKTNSASKTISSRFEVTSKSLSIIYI